MNTSQPLVTHQCMNCDQHHPHHLVRQVLPAENTQKEKPSCWFAPAAAATTSISWRLSLMNTEARFPSIHASAAFTDSAVVHANHVGVNPIELDALSQVISRLSRDESTVAPSSMERELRELEELGYIEISTTQAGTLVVTTRAPGQLLSAYFWSVWIPRHLFSCSLKVSLVPHLCCGTQDSQHLTAVFRIAGSKDAAREFLHQLANNYPGHEPELPELVAVQVGDALSKEAES